MDRSVRWSQPSVIGTPSTSTAICRSSSVGHIPHQAAALLQGYERHGVPMLFDGPDWTLDQLDDAVSKGCNMSADQHKAFIAEEMLEFGEDGFWTILPYDRVRHL